MDWSRGPIASLFDRSGSGTGSPRSPIVSGAATGARYGAVGGLPGAVIGGLFGAAAGWISSRSWNGELASMANDRAQPDYGGGINWNADLGDPQSAGVRSGPPANLAGPGTLSQIQDPDNNGPAWYDDTTMSADDPMGLVPDYGQDGPDGSGGHASPESRRDGNGWGANSGISPMQVGGQNVIIGQDPNQMAVRRLVDYGG